MGIIRNFIFGGVIHRFLSSVVPSLKVLTSKLLFDIVTPIAYIDINIMTLKTIVLLLQAPGMGLVMTSEAVDTLSIE